MEKNSNLIKHYGNLETSSMLIYKEFKKNIFENIFFKNLEYLIDQSELVIFAKDGWKRRPEFFCYDYYTNPHFFPIILLVNNLDSRFHFHPDNLKESYIFAPKKKSIKKTIQIRIP